MNWRDIKDTIRSEYRAGERFKARRASADEEDRLRSGRPSSAGQTAAAVASVLTVAAVVGVVYYVGRRSASS